MKLAPKGARGDGSIHVWEKRQTKIMGPCVIQKASLVESPSPPSDQHLINISVESRQTFADTLLSAT